MVNPDILPKQASTPNDGLGNILLAQSICRRALERRRNAASGGDGDFGVASVCLPPSLPHRSTASCFGIWWTATAFPSTPTLAPHYTPYRCAHQLERRSWHDGRLAQAHDWSDSRSPPVGRAVGFLSPSPIPEPRGDQIQCWDGHACQPTPNHGSLVHGCGRK